MIFKKQIESIIDTLNKISAGDLKQEINIYSGDVGRLAESINTVTENLTEKIDKLEKENSRVHAILNSMIEGVIAVDKDARILSVNPTVEKIFNILKQDAEGRFFLESIPNNDIFEVIDGVLKKGEVVSRELSIVLPVQKVFQVNASPIFENGRISGGIVVIHDVTEIRKLERMRSDFVANISHELKTPLTSIKGFVETLLEGALNDKENSRNFLKVIQEHTDRLNNLINDLLDLSYLESKEAKLETEKVNIRDLFDRVLSGFKSQLKKKNIEVQNDLPSELTADIDRGKIEQVLTNLIDNAIKFNKENGFIKIYSRNPDNKVKITIEDSGAGIPEKDITRIFERFYRVDKARSRELGGTGLGLSLVKHIVELHGGTAGVDSTEGLGSRFYFFLPV